MSEKLKVSETENDETDSFHSFNESGPSYDNLSGSLKSSFSSQDSDYEASLEEENEAETKTGGQGPLAPVQAKPSLAEQVESNHMKNVATASGYVELLNQYKPPKKISMSPLYTNRPFVKCPRLVPQLLNQNMPSEDVFNMNVPHLNMQAPQAINTETAALQKFAFTEIWLEQQQTPKTPKRSPKREFTAALNAYFDKGKLPSLDELTLEEQMKGDANKAIFLESPDSKAAPKPEKKYVSPFEDMPAPKSLPLPSGKKAPIFVPAGFDLTRLVEYKDPNHWARRPRSPTFK